VPAAKLPGWLSDNLKPQNIDFDVRVVCTPDNTPWQPTGLKGVQIRIMEFVPGPIPRLSSQLSFEQGHEPVWLDNQPDLEILIQKGKFNSANGSSYATNWYYRLPDRPNAAPQRLQCQGSASLHDTHPGLVYMSAGQMIQSDSRWRRVHTADPAKWFPGPVEGTDVLPLHGYGSGNIMLVRWNRSAAFKTRIDPRGEELLVLDGAIHDTQGSYKQGTWIRNPITTWQAWGGTAGTLVYYKNGHFTQSTSEP